MPNQRKENLTNNSNLPPIPDKLYFAIGEVAKLCDLQAHVIRYWEQEFSQLSPSKRRGNRRYYKRHDVEVIRLIRRLLYEQRFTIPGARHQLQLQLNNSASDEVVEKVVKVNKTTVATNDVQDALQRAVVGLEEVLHVLM